MTVVLDDLVNALEAGDLAGAGFGEHRNQIRR